MGIIKAKIILSLILCSLILASNCTHLPKEISIAYADNQVSTEPSLSTSANGYTWQDLVKIAIEKSSEYPAAMEEALAEYYRYKARTDFEDLRLTFDYALRDAVGNNRSRFGGDLRFYIPNPFVNKQEIRAGTSAWRESKAEADEIKYQIALTVYELFHEIISVEKNIEILNSRELLLSEWTEHLKARQSARLATQADLMSLELQKIRLKSSVNHAYFENMAARRSLQMLVQIKDDDLRLDIKPIDWETVLASLSDEEKLIEDAFSRSWELSAASASYEKARAMLAVARARQIPWFAHVQAGYDLRSTIVLNSVPSNEWTVQLMINLPVFSWMNSEKKRAVAQMQAAHLRETDIRERIRNTISGNIKDLHEAISLRNEYISLLDSVPIPVRESTLDAETFFKLMDTRLSAAESVIKTELHCAIIYGQIENLVSTPRLFFD